MGKIENSKNCLIYGNIMLFCHYWSPHICHLHQMEPDVFLLPPSDIYSSPTKINICPPFPKWWWPLSKCLEKIHFILCVKGGVCSCLLMYYQKTDDFVCLWAFKIEYCFKRPFHRKWHNCHYMYICSHTGLNNE